jgi:hypothetical protein
LGVGGLADEVGQGFDVGCTVWLGAVVANAGVGKGSLRNVSRRGVGSWTNMTHIIAGVDRRVAT